MDNATRSERTRNALLEAALTIIERDGPARLTLEAIARESGISKGGLMHQFRTKDAVIKALLERQRDIINELSSQYMAECGHTHTQPLLAGQIAALRAAASTSRNFVFAVLEAAAQEPALMNGVREVDVGRIKTIKAEAPDPEMSLLRWVAAWGLTLTTQLGLWPLSDGERDRLFERLLDDSHWTAAAPKDPVKVTKRSRKTAG